LRRIQGSGVVWDTQGHIITASDIAQPGDTLRVIGVDGASARGEFVSQDPDLGISLIHVHGMTSLTPLPRGAHLPEGPTWGLTVAYPCIARRARHMPKIAIARTGGRA
jgi:hypothetical protein